MAKEKQDFPTFFVFVPSPHRAPVIHLSTNHRPSISPPDGRNRVVLNTFGEN